MHHFHSHKPTALALAITLGLCSYSCITQAATSVGNGTASGTDSISIGTTTTTGSVEPVASGGYTIAIGNVATASADNAIAIGTSSTASTASSIAIGNTATANATNTISIGSGSKASVDGNVAFGVNANANSQHGTAIGTNSVAGSGTTDFTGDNANINAVAIGYGALSKAKETTAIGTDAQALANQDIVIGSQAYADQDWSTAIGNQSKAKGHATIAIGPHTLAEASRAITIGDSSTSSGANSISLGVATLSNADNEVTIGTNAKNYATNTVLIGTTSSTPKSVTVTDSVGIGSSASVASSYSTAIGAGSSISQSIINATAIGASASATHSYSVSLGTNSTTFAVDTGTARADGTNTEQSIKLGTTTYTYAGLATTNNGSVSVGNSTITRQVKKVAAGDITSTSTDAVNGSQLYSVATALETTITDGIVVAGNTSTTTGGDALSLGKTLNIVGATKDAAQTYSTANLTTDETIDTTTGASTVTISMSTTPTFDSVTAGSFVTSGGNTITVSGATGTITGLTNTTYDSTVTYNSKRAATEEQLQSAANSIEATGIKAAGNTSTTTGGDTLALGKTLSVIGSAKDAAKTYSTANLTTDEVMGVDGNSTITVSMSTTPTFDSVTAGSFVTSGGNTITVSGATGTITGLTNTTYDSTVTYNSKRAATEEQLQSAVKSTTQSLTDTGLTFAGNSGSDVVKLGKTVTISGTGTTGTFSGNNLKTSESVDTSGNSTIAIEMSTTPVFTTVTAGTFLTSGSHVITISGDTGNITGLTNTSWNNGSPTGYSADRAATEGELKDLQNQISSSSIDYVKSNKATSTEANANASGTDSAALGYGSTASGNYSTAAGNTSTATGVNGTALGYGAKANTDNSVALGAGSVTGTANTGTTATQTKITDATGTSTDFTYAGTASQDNGTVSVGSSGHERQIQYVAAGDISATSTDAVNGSQLYATNQNVTNLTTRVTNDEANISKNTTDITNIKNNIDGGITFAGNTGTNKNVLGSTFNIKGEGTKADSEYSGSNIKTVVDGSTLTIKMDENPTFTSITTGSGSNQVTINNSGVSVGGNTYITNNGLNANNQTISNVANGSITSGSTDAVNGGQLYDTNQSVQRLSDAYTEGFSAVSNKMNSLDNRVNQVGAGAAALAGLHPLDYDPDYKWDVAAGYGGYRSAHSLAIGAFYRPNENYMFSIGTTLGYDNNIYTVGFSYKFGAPSHSNTNTSRAFMARNTANLIEENKQLKAKVTTMGNELEALKAQVTLLAANMKK